MSNPFNCPDSVYATMQTGVAPDLLRAVKKLGPKRIQWHPKEPRSSMGSAKFYSHWKFIGQSGHALAEDILSLAQSEGLIGRAA